MLMKRKAAWKSHFRTDVPQNCPTRHLPELIVGRHTTMTNCQPPAFSLVVGTFSNFVDKSIKQLREIHITTLTNPCENFDNDLSKIQNAELVVD